MKLVETTAITTNYTGVPTKRTVSDGSDPIDRSLMVPARDGSWLAVDILENSATIYVLELKA
jgi:hypothetical protein